MYNRSIKEQQDESMATKEDLRKGINKDLVAEWGTAMRYTYSVKML